MAETPQSRPARPVQDRPNFLFVIADDLGARLGCYGEQAVQSPNLDRLAEQGVLFQRCYTQRPTCGPSRMSMLSGLYPYESGLQNQHADIRDSKIPAISLPHLFRKNGYFTARVGKVFHMGIPSGIGKAGADDPAAWEVAINNTGWDAREENCAKGHKHGQRPGYSVAISYQDPDIPNEKMADGAGTREALRLMKTHHPEKTGKPLMLFMGYYRPHPPMISPQAHWDAISPEAIQLPVVPENDREDIPNSAFDLYGKGKQFNNFHFIPEEVGLAYTRAYYAAIHFIDHEVGKLLDGLKAEGLADNTLIVFTGDQGFHLGEHGYWHKTSAFEEACHVPLIIYDPRSPAEHRRVEGLCGLIDLYPTLCELAGIKPEHPLSGKSLVPFFRDPGLPGKAWELTELKNAKSLRTDRYRYSRLGKQAMLYDHLNDPNEWNNLAGQPEHRPTETRLEGILNSLN